MTDDNISLDCGALRTRYLSGTLTPSALVETLIHRMANGPRPEAWITTVAESELRARARTLEESDPTQLPLFGIPFAVKDNIDVAGLPTTAACPAFSHVAHEGAPAVVKLLEAGALLLGKTNLDQLATGLVGTRSPYGAVRNAFDPSLISGGSSSGSAVVVATGLASFALGTDTAGSGRVPAAFNNLVGLKPTRGLVSSRGIVPACRSLDCVSVFALCVEDASDVLGVMAGPDSADPFSRPAPHAAPALPETIAGTRFGVPRRSQLQFYGDGQASAAFEAALERIQRLGGVIVEIDYEPFQAAAALLYEGPWITERWVAVDRILGLALDALDPVTRAVIEPGRDVSAADLFAGYYRLRELRQTVARLWRDFDVMLTPTAPTIYPIEALEADPFKLNANLGFYTNFVNLLDLCAINVPGPRRADDLPSGITLVAPAFADNGLCILAARLHPVMSATAGATGLPLPAGRALAGPGGEVELLVCGAHMSGLPLNGELTRRGARLLRHTRTAPSYCLYALTQFDPPRPGLIRTAEGEAIDAEIWTLTHTALGELLATIPAPLGLGRVCIDDGSELIGFLCESHAAIKAKDISGFGGWRQYLSASTTEIHDDAQPTTSIN